MSKKSLLGLAVVGGAIYLYDRDVSPIFPRDNKGNFQGVSQAGPSKELKQDFRKLGDDTKDFGAQFKKTAEGSVAELRNRTDAAVSTIKESETYNKWSQKLDDYQKHVKTEAEIIDNKPLPNRLAAKYIRFVNSIGQTEDEKLKELASSTSGRQQEIKNDLRDSKQSWSSWWSGKKSEAESKKNEFVSNVEGEKNSWFNWGQKKADNAEANFRKEKNSWLNWADDNSEDAKKALDDAKKEKNDWVAWGSSKADGVESAAKNTQNNLEAKKNEWVSWGSAKVDDAQHAAKEGHKESKAGIDEQSHTFNEDFEYAKKKASEEYEAAKKNLDSWTQQAKDKANGVWEKADDEHLKKAGDDLQRAFTNLKRFGEDLTK